MKLVIDTTDVFVIFDSHSRPSHPDGAVFILNTSIHRTAARLKEILPVDRRLLSDSDMQWQAQLLAHYSGHIFVSKGTKQSPAHFTQTVVESSLAILALRAEVSDLKLRLSILTSENERLQTEVQTTEAQRGRIKTQPASSKHYSSDGHRSRSGSQRRINAVPGPSRVLSRHNAEQTAHKQREWDENGRHRRAQKERLARTSRRHFKCRICMEEHVEDNVARIDSCGHRFCRECVRNYVAFKLRENRFPVLCPVCMTEQKGEPGGV
jgi:Zinc finger, C3HC4 type (RING finger)